MTKKVNMYYWPRLYPYLSSRTDNKQCLRKIISEKFKIPLTPFDKFANMTVLIIIINTDSSGEFKGGHGRKRHILGRKLHVLSA